MQHNQSTGVVTDLNLSFKVADEVCEEYHAVGQHHDENFIHVLSHSLAFRLERTQEPNYCDRSYKHKVHSDKLPNYLVVEANKNRHD